MFRVIQDIGKAGKKFALLLVKEFIGCGGMFDGGTY